MSLPTPPPFPPEESRSHVCQHAVNQLFSLGAVKTPTHLIGSRTRTKRNKNKSTQINNDSFVAGFSHFELFSQTVCSVSDHLTLRGAKTQTEGVTRGRAGQTPVPQRSQFVFFWVPRREVGTMTHLQCSHKYRGASD